MLRILVVGQTPPPFGGQAISTQRLLRGNYRRVRLFHVRLAFSAGMDEVGRFRFGKLWHLLTVIILIIRARVRHRPKVLYYMPAGPNRVPMFRDLAILLATRWLFRWTVFHFRAGGISELYGQLSPALRFLFRRAYFGADLAIQLSHLNPPDGEVLRARRVVVVPNGIEDRYPRFGKQRAPSGSVPVLLYVGVLRESKGILVLLDALRRLRDSGMAFKVKLVGRFQSEEFRKAVEESADTCRLADRVEYTGVLTGDDLWQAYSEADIFCFPSFFESETFGNVVVEAMQFELPVVATRWRGVPDVVRDGGSGYLVPVRDSGALAERIAVLLTDSSLRESMGRRGRKLFLENFTVGRFWRNMEDALASVGRNDREDRVR